MFSNGGAFSSTQLAPLLLGLAMATARNGPVEHLRLENEIIVLAACQFLFVMYYVFAFPTLHGKGERGGEEKGVSSIRSYIVPFHLSRHHLYQNKTRFVPSSQASIQMFLRVASAKNIK